MKVWDAKGLAYWGAPQSDPEPVRVDSCVFSGQLFSRGADQLHQQVEVDVVDRFEAN